mmetsp:Transcript_37623/g.106894  ORF Transcript_37623/g.106894 Transcript_37623/m.106894 type:complete len:254 (+) Transcript_37623:289-1050(+)
MHSSNFGKKSSAAAFTPERPVATICRTTSRIFAFASSLMRSSPAPMTSLTKPQTLGAAESATATARCAKASAICVSAGSVTAHKCSKSGTLTPPSARSAGGSCGAASPSVKLRAGGSSAAHCATAPAKLMANTMYNGTRTAQRSKRGRSVARRPTSLEATCSRIVSGTAALASSTKPSMRPLTTSRGLFRSSGVGASKSGLANLNAASCSRKCARVGRCSSMRRSKIPSTRATTPATRSLARSNAQWIKSMLF